MAGLIAVALYWANDRFSVENLVGIWVGLDIDKIELLPKKQEIKTEKVAILQKQSKFNLRIFENLPKITEETSSSIDSQLVY